MAVDLSKIVHRRSISFEELRGKAIAIDAYNMIYQFLSIIRQPDGTPLTDQHGNVTSHLSGILYRTTDMLDMGIQPIYVFDGLPSVLKQKTNAARSKRREEAYAAWQEAKESGNVEAMRAHAMASTRIDKRIVESSKELLSLMGIGFINAPGEGEAQASWMADRGLVYAAASQDYDTLMFGARRVARNLSFSGRRKLPGKNVYVNVEPEIVDLDETLRGEGISREQLIWIGLLLGTDFNDGIKGIGPKTAMKIVKASKSIEDVERAATEKNGSGFSSDVREVFDLFMNPEVRKMGHEEVEKLFGMHYDTDGIIRFMCKEHGFSEDRIAKVVERIGKSKASSRQKGMGAWLK